MTLLQRQLQLVVITLLLLSASAGAQMRKIHLDTISTYNSFEKLSFYSASSGYLASTGSSNSWVGFTSDSGRTIARRNITFANVNLNGHLINMTFPFSISGVKAFDQNRIIVCGDYGFVPAILSSNYGGNSYTLVFHSQFNPMQLRTGITDMIFPQNGNTGFAVDADRILRTTNGGSSWSVVRVDPGRYFNRLEAIDANNVFAYSTGYQTNALFRTTDGGSTWQQVILPVMNQGKVSSLFFLNAQTG